MTAPTRRAILISAKSKRIPSELHTHTHTIILTLIHVYSADSFIVISSVRRMSRGWQSAKYTIFIGIYYILNFLCRYEYIYTLFNKRFSFKFDFVIGLRRNDMRLSWIFRNIELDLFKSPQNNCRDQIYMYYITSWYLQFLIRISNFYRFPLSPNKTWREFTAFST